MSQKNEVMAEYLKGLEPQDFHDMSNKLHALKSCKLPQQLIDFLTGGLQRMDLSDNKSGIRYIEFFHLIDTVEMKMGRQKLLRISSNVDQYSHILIVWKPSKKMIGYADIEHQEHGTIATTEEFLADPAKQIVDFFDQM
ncbi:hypothetical protein MHB43_19420 [Paenibacillus sp. FSL H8-0317]